MDRVRVGGCVIGELEQSLLQHVLQAGQVGPGEMTKMFERELAAAHGYKHGLCLNSGQSALMIALKAESIRQGKPLRVALPAVTYISSFAAIVQAGCEPVLVDVTSDARANMIYDYIPNDVDAIMPVHLFGRAIDDRTLRQRFPSHFILEDACESAYAPGIGFGDALCLSFYSSHTITAGFGGAVLTNDDDLYFKMWQLVNHGRAKHDDYTETVNLSERFTFSEIGWSLKFSDLNAAVGLAQHIGREQNIQIRQAIGALMKERLAPHEWVETAPLDGHSFMMFPMVIDQAKDRPEVAKTRAGVISALNDADVETRMLMPLTNQLIVKKLLGDDIEAKYTGAQYLNEMGLYVGSHPLMTPDAIDRISEVFEGLK